MKPLGGRRLAPYLPLQQAVDDLEAQQLVGLELRQHFDHPVLTELLELPDLVKAARPQDEGLWCVAKQVRNREAPVPEPHRGWLP